MNDAWIIHIVGNMYIIVHRIAYTIYGYVFSAVYNSVLTAVAATLLMFGTLNGAPLRVGVFTKYNLIPRPR